MDKSMAYRLGRLYGRIPKPARLPVTALLVLAAVAVPMRFWGETAAVPTNPSEPLSAAQQLYTPAPKPDETMLASARTRMDVIRQKANIFEEGSHLVVEMKNYLPSADDQLRYARVVADTDVVLHGNARTIFFYDPSGKQIAQADRLNGIRLK